MELFEQIRREYEQGAGTIRAVARKLGIHRRLVRQALADAQPPYRKRAERAQPQLRPVKEFIDATLEADQRAPRKIFTASFKTTLNSLRSLLESAKTLVSWRTPGGC